MQHTNSYFPTRMEHRDHLLLQIEQLGMVLRRLLAEVTGSPKDGAMIEQADSVERELLAAIGLGSQAFGSLSSEELTAALQGYSAASVENLDLMAEVLLARSVACPPEANTKAQKLKELALAVLEHANTVDTNYSMERQQKLAALRSATL